MSPELQQAETFLIGASGYANNAKITIGVQGTQSQRCSVRASN
jgi:hypothetical protein